jgi:hypothetical protein
VDVVVELRTRFSDRERQEKLEAERLELAFESGRNFSNYLEELGWPQREVLLFLKSIVS